MKAKKIKKSNARKTSTVPTKVYTYGALSLSPEQQRLVNDQLFAAHRYRNTLVEIERKRRDDYRGIRGKLSRPLAALEAAYDVAQAAYSEARKRLSQVPKAERAMSPVAVEVRALAKARNKSWLRVRGERGVVERKHFRKADTAFRRLKKVRRAAVLRKTGAAGPRTMAAITRAVRAKMQTGTRWPLAWRKKDKSQWLSEEAHRAARAASGCFSGVYAAVDTAAARSFKDTAFNPRFASYDHTGWQMQDARNGRARSRWRMPSPGATRSSRSRCARTSTCVARSARRVWDGGARRPWHVCGSAVPTWRPPTWTSRS